MTFYIKYKNNIILIAILVLAAALRFYRLDYQSLWLDEIHTINECNPLLSLSQTFNALYASEPHPPLYFLIIKGLFSVFGTTSFVARCFSALIGIAGVWAIFLLGKELFNRKAGLYAAALLCVNYFHIYYSQDARPYTLLFFTSTISFYFLVKFIRTPSLRTAVWYGIFSGIMLYAHLFSLFVLCSQYLILLYFVCLPYKEGIKSKKFFLYSLLAGIITGLMYVPCLKVLLMSAQRTSMWIPPPPADAYLSLFKEFFANSNILFALILVALVFFFKTLIVTKKESKQKRFSDKLSFTAFILLLWIITVLVLALIRSYLSLPIIVSRYFISILPAVILIVTLGILQIRNRNLQYVFIGIFIVYSLVDTIFLEKYYRVKSKTEFREATNFIIDNNKDNTPVVTSLSWYMPFFLKNDKVNYDIVDKPLDIYVKEAMNDSTAIKPFWYIDGHVRPYTPSKEVRQFLEDKFYIESNFEGYDIWTRFYVPKKNAKVIDIAKFGELKQHNGDTIISSVEAIDNTANELKISGWSYFPNHDATKSRIDLLLINKNNAVFRLPTINGFRKDVVRYYNLDKNIINCGFTSEYNISNLEPGEYKLGIYIINKVTKKEGFVITDKIVVKQ